MSRLLHNNGLRLTQRGEAALFTLQVISALAMVLTVVLAFTMAADIAGSTR